MSRQPDLVIDFDTSHSTLTNPSFNHHDEQQEDRASVVSFVSSVDVSGAAPTDPSEAVHEGDQIKFGFQPSDSVQSTSATPTANLFANLFQNPPKLKHVTPPTVKNAALDSAVAAAPRNSVQAEKERIFEEQARQERERQERERQEREQQEREQREREYQQQQQLHLQQQQQQQQQQHAQSMSPPSQAKKVHFSEVDLGRRQLAASNYNKPASGFKPTPPPPPAPQLEHRHMNSAPAPIATQSHSFTPPTPISKPTPPPPTPRQVTQVARPKFRATNAPARSWNTDTTTTSATSLTAGQLDKQLNSSETLARPFQTKKWSPSQPVEKKQIDVSDLPTPQSMQMYKPPSPRASMTKPTPPTPPPFNQHNHTGNSVVMDNLNSQLGYGSHSRVSPPSQVSVMLVKAQPQCYHR